MIISFTFIHVHSKYFVDEIESSFFLQLKDKRIKPNNNASNKNPHFFLPTYKNIIKCFMKFFLENLKKKIN